jgi:murein DD-endopeptidase MepM/ murein hydrolase activator NlpD
LLSFLFILTPVSYANAGFLSFLGSILTGNDGTASPTPQKSQDYVNAQSNTILQAVVRLKPKLASGGGDITIVNDNALLSDVSPSGSIADIAAPAAKSDQISIYVVRPGDSLSQIAKMFGVSISTIMWANDISRGDSIHEGETLVILPVTGIQHTVVKGETIKSIAEKYHGDAQDIIAFNNLPEDGSLTVGSTVIIPDGELTAPAPSSSGSSSRSLYNPAHGTGGPVYTGYYIKPVEAVLSQGIHGYNAVDLAAPVGTPVVASASGMVIVSKYRAGNPWFGGYGNYVVISHDNGSQTLYAHLSKVIVGDEWHVVQGQIIGYVGATGKATGPHLHFEVRGAQNPFMYYSIGEHD